MYKLYIALLCVLPLTVSAAKPSTLIWCLDHLPPRQNYLDGELPTGAMVEMMQQVAENLRLELVFTLPTPTNRCLEQLSDGKADIVTGLLKTAEREKDFMLFSFDTARPESWFINNTAIVDNDKLQKVTIIRDRHYTDDFEIRYQTAGYQLDEAANLDDALAKLYFKDTDIVVGPEHIIQAAINRNARYRDTLKLTPQNLQPVVEVHVAIARNGRYAKREAEFIEIFKQIRAKGNYQFYQ